MPDVAMPPVIHLPGGALAGSHNAGTGHRYAFSRYAGTDSAGSDPTIFHAVPATKVGMQTAFSDDSSEYSEELKRKASLVDAEKAQAQRIL